MSLFVMPNPISIFIPISLFVLSGFLYAKLNKDNLSELIDSIHYINVLLKPRERANEVKLRILTHRPNLIDDGRYVFLTPTTTLLKMFVRRKITKLYHERKIRRSGDTKHLLTFLKDEHTKPSSTLLEFRVIALIVGLLASIGITLTWNSMATRPIITAIGLLILCFNLGFLIYIFKKSPRDKNFILLLLVFIIIVMIFERGQWNLTRIFLGTS